MDRRCSTGAAADRHREDYQEGGPDDGPGGDPYDRGRGQLLAVGALDVVVRLARDRYDFARWARCARSACPRSEVSVGLFTA